MQASQSFLFHTRKTSKKRKKEFISIWRLNKVELGSEEKSDANIPEDILKRKIKIRTCKSFAKGHLTNKTKSKCYNKCYHQRSPNRSIVARLNHMEKEKMSCIQLETGRSSSNYLAKQSRLKVISIFTGHIDSRAQLQDKYIPSCHLCRGKMKNTSASSKRNYLGDETYNLFPKFNKYILWCNTLRKYCHNNFIWFLVKFMSAEQ